MRGNDFILETFSMKKLKKKKILVVFGTRPEAIKMAPLIQVLQKIDSFDVKLCVTAQHREMLDQVLSVFNLSPNYDLDIMGTVNGLAELSAEIIRKFNIVLHEYEPDLVIVHGDTSTTLNTSLAAFYAKIPVAHVEAGLRTNNFFEPWPEEMNRKLTGSLAKYHFAPTENALQNLLTEKVPSENILVTGNTVIDALKIVSEQISCDKKLQERLVGSLSEVNFHNKIILVTTHRRENFGKGLDNICASLNLIANKFTDYDLVVPVHMNPKVKNVVLEKLGKTKNIILLDPLDYVPFVYLMKQSEFILTDSGGIQEEAPALNKPVLVMRNVTERQEAVDAGGVLLVGTDPKYILKEVTSLISNRDHYDKMANSISPYGSGDASIQIAEFLTEALKGET